MASAADPFSKPAARIGLLGVDASSALILADCFRQFGIEAAPVATAAEIAAGDCSGCVIPLNAPNADVLRQLREADPHTVIYGLCGSLREAVRFSEHGINAVFETPVQRQAALAVVRSTHLLVLHELRRYVRVPLIAGVGLKTGTETISATSVEISAGGMSLSVHARLAVPQAVLASFDLPGAATISVRSVICWTRDADGTAGIRFDPQDPHRAIVRRWVDEYLGA